MNEGTAIDMAKEKMKELKVEDYILRYRHLRLDAKEKREIKAENQIYVLTYPLYNLKLQSKLGIYDLADDGLNELQHVHTGVLKLENQSNIRLDVKFIQAIPLNKRKKIATKNIEDGGI